MKAGSTASTKKCWRAVPGRPLLRIWMPAWSSGRFANRIDVVVAVAQFVLQHLAHGVARQRVDEHHGFRQLEFGQPPVEGSLYAALVEGGARLLDDDGGDALAEILVRAPDHRAFDDARYRVDLG